MLETIAGAMLRYENILLLFIFGAILGYDALCFASMDFDVLC
jgi:hypothetical protein